MKRLIVVIGINGRQSSSVVEALLEYPEKWFIRGTSTDPTSIHCQGFAQRGVEIVKCDISNKEECCQALADAYGVFSINKHWDAMDQDEYKQAVNLVEAAKITNIQHLIISGLPNTTDFGKRQFDVPPYPLNRTQIEDYIQGLSQNLIPPYVSFIRMGFYYQNVTTFFVPDPTKVEFRYPLLLDARIPLYDVRDTGRVVGECFLYPEKWGRRQVVPIVAEQLTMEQICARIQEVIGKDIHFVPLSYEEAPLRLHRETVNNLRWYNDIGSIDERQAEKTHEIWPKMVMFADWLRENQWFMD